MSYKNDDMIANSDRGYAMNLDNIINDLYKKKEQKIELSDKEIEELLIETIDDEF